MADLLEGLKAVLADRYRIERELGRGGMATVYLADDRRHHRQVAVKVLRPDLAATLGPERFLREIEIAAQLQHPNILPLLDSGEASDFLYYVMPYVEGQSLRERLAREGALPVGDAVRIMRDVVDALTEAHRHGVVHRDIKPENVLLSGRHALVTDFGVAKAVSEATGRHQLTTAGVALGTPAYMAPEQASADPHLDHRVDIYAVGAVLYELLSGRPVFMGTTPQMVLSAHVAEAPEPVTKHRDTVPAALEAAVMRCLEKRPADRWQRAEDLLAPLEALTTPSGGITPTATQPVAAAGSRSRWMRPAGVVAVLALGAAAVWGVALRLSPERASSAIQLDSTAIAVLPFRVIGAESDSIVQTLAFSIGDLFELKITGEYGRRIAHPPSVVQRWRNAGGRTDGALSEQDELTLGRDLSVGAVVRGTVLQSDSGITLAASMVDVRTGATRVPTVRVEGGLAERFDLVDQLMVLLLARDFGYSSQESPRLRQYAPEAVQALLAGHLAPLFSVEEKRYYRAALAADSNLVDAAFWVYANGENPADTAELRYAWDHQTKLTERLRAYLQVIAAGRHGDVRTEAQRIAGYEALTRRWPEWLVMWAELGGELAGRGALASVPDWQTRARTVLSSMESSWDYVLFHLANLAYVAEDTADARDLTDRLFPRAGATGLIAGFAPAYRWRLATMRGDTAKAREYRSALSDTATAAAVIAFALADGRGTPDADRAAASGGCVWSCPWMWYWVRGRHREWRDSWPEAREFLRTNGPPSDKSMPMFQSLYLGRPEDAVALEAAADMERIARSAVGATVSSKTRAMAVAWTALWELAHGEPGGADAAIEYLRREAAHGPNYDGWTGLIEVLRQQLEGDDAHAALLRLDSILRPFPLPTGEGEWFPLPVEVQNLLLARLLARDGQPELALQAIRRRPYSPPLGAFYSSLPEYLREEGRLAAVVGDTAGAIKAYTHYLALREDPDPPWRAAWDSVRTELAALRAR